MYVYIERGRERESERERARERQRENKVSLGYNGMLFCLIILNLALDYILLTVEAKRCNSTGFREILPLLQKASKNYEKPGDIQKYETLCSYTHTHTRAHTHTYIHTYIHTYMDICTHIHMDIHIDIEPLSL